MMSKYPGMASGKNEKAMFEKLNSNLLSQQQLGDLKQEDRLQRLYLQYYQIPSLDASYLTTFLFRPSTF